MTPSHPETMSPSAATPWFVSAVVTALAGAAFAAYFGGLVVHRSLVLAEHVDQQEQQLDDLKRTLRTAEDPDARIVEIRALDARNRQMRFQALEEARFAGYALLASLVVCMGAVKWAHRVRPRRPCPQPETNHQEAERMQGLRARRVLTAGLAVLLAGAVWLAFTGLRFELPGTEISKASIPEEHAMASAEDFARNWHRFRGPGGAGVTSAPNIPIQWNGLTGENILWKTPIPLPGHNSPIVWQDKVFCSGADPNQQVVYCMDRESGRLLWTGSVPVNPTAADLNISDETSRAASTMATDGYRVYAIFATGDLGCFDFEGKLCWVKHLGVPQSMYGYASSLEVYHNRVLVQLDQGDADDDLSRMLAIDGATGNVVWQQQRPVANVWTSPILVHAAGRDQLIAVSDPWTMAYDPNTGRELWRARCGGSDLAPSPVYAGGLVFALEPYSTLYAIKPDGTGDVTQTHMAWRMQGGAPDICSPVSNGEWICLLDTMGEAVFYRVSDGNEVMTREFDGPFQASPSLVGDALYLLNEKGVMSIAKVSPEVSSVTKNNLGEPCLASPAFVEGRIFIRSKTHMWAIGREK